MGDVRTEDTEIKISVGMSTFVITREDTPRWCSTEKCDKAAKTRHFAADFLPIVVDLDFSGKCFQACEDPSHIRNAVNRAAYAFWQEAWTEYL
jgi:hypothetical protein